MIHSPVGCPMDQRNAGGSLFLECWCWLDARGRYVINSFRYKRISILAGELGLNFVVAPRATLYIGRLILKVPRRVSLGTPYTVEIQNAREATIGALQMQHPDLGRDALDALIQKR